jgi:D-alanyl-lipoteichoic acid acyltransferase DltB (MBOAT superfamily)
LLVLRYAGRPFYQFIGQQKLFMPQFISWALTFGSVILGCLFFMETNTRRLLQKLLVLINPGNYSLANLGEAVTFFNDNGATALTVTLVFSLGLLLMEQIGVWRKGKTEYDLLVSPWMSRILLALTILFAANAPSPFIYFEF